MGSPDEFRKLINELCKHESGDIPTVTVTNQTSETDENKSEETEEEDKLVKILPSSSSNVPKKFHIQYAGLMAAVSSNVCTDFLEKEITESQSVMFKKFVIVNYVKQQNDVNALKELVLTSVPFVQKQIIKSLLSNGRSEALDNMVTDILNKFGADWVAKFIHGCSSDVCLKITKQNADILESDNLDWYRCCKFQPKLIIRELTEQIIKDCKMRDGNGSDDWSFDCLSLSNKKRGANKKKPIKSGWLELLKHPSSDGITESILELVLAHPKIVFDGYHYTTEMKKNQILRYKEKNSLESGWFISIPTLIWKHQSLF